LININTASLQHLESLPGVGPVIAQRIVNQRPFATVDDLIRVKGLGKKKMAQIRFLIETE